MSYAYGYIQLMGYYDDHDHECPNCGGKRNCCLGSCRPTPSYDICSTKCRIERLEYELFVDIRSGNARAVEADIFNLNVARNDFPATTPVTVTVKRSAARSISYVDDTDTTS